MMRPTLVDLPTFTDRRGALTAMEKVPFDIKRAFWLHDLTGWRGGHAHKKCEQLIVAIHGGLLVKTPGHTWQLMGPCVGLYVPPGTQVDLFGQGIVLVLCSEYYDEDDYVFP